jgi:hypothetical protein
LDESRTGLEAVVIRHLVHKPVAGFLIKGTSFHPMISLMTKEGMIVRDKDRLALKSRIGEGSQVND